MYQQRFLRLVVATLLTSAILRPRLDVRAQARPSDGAVRVRISGIVFDSIAQRPLRDGVVQLVGADDPSHRRSVRTSDDGRYVFDSVGVGVYVLGFLHDRLDTLGIEGPLRRVEVQALGDIDVPLALPSAATLIAQRCGPGPGLQSRTLFMGVVRSARPSAAVIGPRVRAQWPEVLVGATGIERRSPVRFVNAAESGAFFFCDVPTDVVISSRAFAGEDSSGVVELRVPLSGLLIRDLFVGPTTRGSPSGAPTGAVRSALRGAARVRGVVRSLSGSPLAGARLVVWGTGSEATTNVSGQFSLQDLPLGTYTLESRALGYEPRRVPIDLFGGSETTMDVAMTVVATTVDTVRVRANANRTVPLAEFERRRKTGFGHFIDEAEVQERRAMYVADLFRRTPGMTILPGQAGNDRVLMRSAGGGGACVPALFVNGVMVPNPEGVLETFVNPWDVRAVEVYSRVASVPLQFESRTGCGSIVMWTGAGSATKPRR